MLKLSFSEFIEKAYEVRISLKTNARFVYKVCELLRFHIHLICKLMQQHEISLETECYYHVYNRGINGESLFREERNYHFFLGKYATYIEPVAETYAYCLLKNHFHLLIRIRSQETLRKFMINHTLHEDFFSYNI